MNPETFEDRSEQIVNKFLTELLASVPEIRSVSVAIDFGKFENQALRSGYITGRSDAPGMLTFEEAFGSLRSISRLTEAIVGHVRKMQRELEIEFATRAAEVLDSKEENSEGSSS